MTRLATERLASSWAKLDRARHHVMDFRAAVVKASDGSAPPRVLEFSRQYDAQTERVLFIAKRLPEATDEWALMLGDAIHNMRCALDHLWWQLAIDHLGRDPYQHEAGDIQFPILPLQEKAWARHRFLTHVSDQAAAKAKELQAYDRPEAADAVLGTLATLSNHDKHRELRPAFFISTDTSFGTPPDPQQLIDCEMPTSVDRATGRTLWSLDVEFGPDAPRVGDVVFGVRVRRTGPRPDIDMTPQISGDVAFGDGECTNATLDELGSLVHYILNNFAPLLAAVRPTV